MGLNSDTVTTTWRTAAPLTTRRSFQSNSTTAWLRSSGSMFDIQFFQLWTQRPVFTAVFHSSELLTSTARWTFLCGKLPLELTMMTTYSKRVLLKMLFFLPHLFLLSFSLPCVSGVFGVGGGGAIPSAHLRFIWPPPGECGEASHLKEIASAFWFGLATSQTHSHTNTNVPFTHCALLDSVGRSHLHRDRVGPFLWAPVSPAQGGCIFSFFSFLFLFFIILD